MCQSSDKSIQTSANKRRIRGATVVAAVGFGLIALLLPGIALAAHGDNFQSVHLPIKTAVYFMSFAIAAMGLLMVFAFDQYRQVKKTRDALSAKASLLDTALENITQGFASFDENDRLTAFNASYLELYNLSSDKIRLGMTPAEIMDVRRQAGAHCIEHERLTEAMEQYRNTDVAGSVESTLDDGRVIAVTRRQLRGGGFVASHNDVTGYRNLELEIETSKQFLYTVLDHIPLAMVVRNISDRRVTFANAAYFKFFNLTEKDVLGRTADEFLPASALPRIYKADNEVIRNGDLHVTEYPVSPSDPRIVLARRVILKNDDGQPKHLITILEEITAQRRAAQQIEESRRFYESIVDNIPMAVSVKDATTKRFLFVNRESETLIGRTRDQIIGQTSDSFYPSHATRDIEAHDNAAIAARGGVHVGEYPVTRPDHSIGLFMSRRVALLNRKGEPKYLVATHLDVTDRRQAESRLTHMAYHDLLTDLPNRAAFIQSLDQMIESCSGTTDRFAILSVDLDWFKEINEVFGHAFGDRLLVEISYRIQKVAGGAVVARLSGDEFGLILDGEQPTVGRELAERIVAAIKPEFTIDGKTIRTACTVGVSIYPDDGADSTSLLANADAALYRAKSEARGSIRFFEAEMDKQLRERRAIYHDLGSAIDNNELKLYYQPQSNESGEIIGFEALVRWFHPVRGLVSPAQFIPLAEDTGLIVDMGAWILREACREAASWPNPLQVAVNLSPVQFLHGDLVALVHQTLLETGLAPDRLEVEITEGVLIRDFERGVSLLRRLKAIGVRVAMDDFGSGYSSLNYLQSFPFDKIKIDRGFIMNLGRNRHSAAIVRAVINLGHGLDIPILAEGVETSDQLAFLQQELCDQFQGYFIGKPGPIEQYAMTVGRDDVAPSCLEAKVS